MIHNVNVPTAVWYVVGFVCLCVCDMALEEPACKPSRRRSYTDVQTQNMCSQCLLNASPPPRGLLRYINPLTSRPGWEAACCCPLLCTAVVGVSLFDGKHFTQQALIAVFKFGCYASTPRSLSDFLLLSAVIGARYIM